MSQLRRQQERLDEQQIQVKIVVFDDDWMAKAYAVSSKLDWPVLLDRQRDLYRSYGMMSGSWWDIYNPVSIARYVRLILQGQSPGRPGRHWRQLGGDVLIDSNKTIRFHHVSKNPHDRPDAERIFQIVQDDQRKNTGC